MERRAFGTTGLSVSVVGLGAGALGDPGLSEDEAARLLHGALDLGITLVDTARSYGASEERIGRHLAARRGEFVLCTKVGYGAPGHADWTYGCVEAGVDRARGLLRADVLDVVFLHSCPADTLRRGEVIDALEHARDAGKVRVLGYSGDGDALAWAVASGRFGAIECSVNPVDRRALADAIPAARARGMGVLAKRPLANAPWEPGAADPQRPDRREYHARWRALSAALPRLDEPLPELFLRHAAHAPGVDAALVGTRRLARLAEAAAAVARGPLEAAARAALDDAYAAVGQDWPGLV